MIGEILEAEIRESEVTGNQYLKLLVEADNERKFMFTGPDSNYVFCRICIWCLVDSHKDINPNEFLHKLIPVTYEIIRYKDRDIEGFMFNVGVMR